MLRNCAHCVNMSVKSTPDDVSSAGKLDRELQTLNMQEKYYPDEVSY